MKRFLISGWGLCLGLWLASGCSKEEPAPVKGQGTMATQGTPVVVDPNSGVDLAELNRELKRWMVANQKAPSSFEDYAAQSKAAIPPAPAGKKYVLSKEMRVVLVDR